MSTRKQCRPTFGTIRDRRHADGVDPLTQFLEIGDGLANVVVGYDAGEPFHLVTFPREEPRYRLA